LCKIFNADGHAEIRKWRDAAIFTPKTIDDHNPLPAKIKDDIRWLRDRTVNP